MRRVLGQHPARVIRREIQDPIDSPIPQVPHGDLEIGVIDRFKGSRVGGNGPAHFPQLDGGHAMILINHRDAQVMDLSAKGVSQNHQLHDGHDHRHQDERGAAHKLAQVAFHQSPDSIHDVLPLYMRKKGGNRIL